MLALFLCESIFSFRVFFFAFVLTSVHLASNHFPFKCILDEFDLTTLTGLYVHALILLGELLKPANFVLLVYFLDMRLSDGTGIHRREIQL